MTAGETSLGRRRGPGSTWASSRAIRGGVARRLNWTEADCRTPAERSPEPAGGFSGYPGNHWLQSPRARRRPAERLPKTAGGSQNTMKNHWLQSNPRRSGTKTVLTELKTAAERPPNARRSPQGDSQDGPKPLAEPSGPPNARRTPAEAGRTPAGTRREAQNRPKTIDYSAIRGGVARKLN